MITLPSRRRLATVLLASTMFGAPVAAAADEAAVVDQDQATRVSEVVVTASATRIDVRDAPASISVITRDEIERQPVQSLGELLGRLPGVTGGISPTGAMSKITIRGLPDNYALILVDGRRISDSSDISYRPDLGRQDLNWISPDMIERIEVVRGPMSSIYGSDAMGGVINIITRRVAPDWRGSTNANYTRSQDSDRGDSYQLSVNATGPLSDVLGLRLGASYARTNPDEMDISNNGGTAGVVNQNLNGVLTWMAVPGHVFSLEGAYGVEDPIAPSALSETGSAQSSWGAETERTSLRIGHEGEWNGLESRLDVYHNAFVNEDQAESGGAAELEETIADLLMNFETNLVWLHRVAFGAQYRSEELTNTSTIGTIPIDYDGEVVEGATLTGDTAAVFVEDQLTLRENLLLTLGARLDSHDRYGEHVSPRAYLVWRPSESWTVRGGVSQGFRAPCSRRTAPGRPPSRAVTAATACVTWATPRAAATWRATPT